MAGDAGESPRPGEHEALARLRQLLPGAPEGEVWFGDDAAVVRACPAGPLLLLATDTVVGDLDADLSLTTLSDLGWKAMAVNLSDIAAMGGTPAQAVVSVVGLGPDDLERLYEGVVAAANEYRCPVVGGDLSAGRQIVVTVAVTGTVDGPPVLRRGARPGDAIWVTGPLGASAAGLRVLRERGVPDQRNEQPNGPGQPDEEEKALMAAHARPRPALAAGTGARRAGASGEIVMRFDSGFWSHATIAVLGRLDVRYTMAVHCGNSAVASGIASSDESAWEPIAYTPDGIAQVAEVDYKGHRLVVRRTRLVDVAQQALFPGWRHHGFLSDLAGTAVELDRFHRQHATVELAIRDIKEGSGMAHCPSGNFAANGAWLACAVLAHNLCRWTAILGQVHPADQLTVVATLRSRLVCVPGRLVNRSGTPTLRGPLHWPWQHQFNRALVRTRALPAVASG